MLKVWLFQVEFILILFIFVRGEAPIFICLCWTLGAFSLVGTCCGFTVRFRLLYGAILNCFVFAPFFALLSLEKASAYKKCSLSEIKKNNFLEELRGVVRLHRFFYPINLKTVLSWTLDQFLGHMVVLPFIIRIFLLEINWPLCRSFALNFKLLLFLQKPRGGFRVFFICGHALKKFSVTNNLPGFLGPSCLFVALHILTAHLRQQYLLF